MSNILILHSGLNGMTNACLEVARRLEGDNHNVFTSSIQDQEEFIKSNHLKYIKINPVKLKFTSEQYQSFGGRLRTAFFSKRKFFDDYYNSLKFTDFDLLIKQFQIDLLLIDIEIHEYIIYASSQKLPLILLSQWFSTDKSNKNYPAGSKRINYSKFHHKVEWIKSKIVGLSKTIGNNIKTLGLNRTQFIRHLAVKVNFDSSTMVSHHFPRPFSYVGLPCISMTHKKLELEDSESLKQFYSYPMVCENRVETRSKKFELDFNKIKLKIKEEKKYLVVATHTTMKNGTSINNQNLVKALSQLEDCISIVSIGKNTDAHEFSTHPNVYVYQSIPQLKVLAEADLSINHGGIHTINESLHFKVPMLIYSGQKYDQNGCTARIAKSGCGIGRFNKSPSINEIKNDVKEILHSKKYKEKISQLSNDYFEVKAEKSFEKYIQSFMS